MNTQDKPQVQLNMPALPVLVILLILLQLILPYQGWMVLLVGFGGVWLLAYGWARSLARGLALLREMRFGWAQVGDQLEERFTLSNHGWAPALWVELVDHSTLPGYSASRVTGVDSRSENRWTVKGTCSRRGVFMLGPTTLRSGDPFGIYTVTCHYSPFTHVMVVPPVIPLPRIEVAPGGRAGEGRRRVSTLERSVNAGGVRDYIEGDTLNLIHWRVTAHRDGLYVRRLESMPSSDWWILLDLDRRAQVGEGENSTLEHGVILAASLADQGLRLGRSVGLVASGDSPTDPSAPELIWLPPRGGETRRWEILRALALVSPGRHSLGDLLAQVRPSIGRRASLVIVTPAVNPDWAANLMPLVWRGIVPTVLLLDPVSFGGKRDSYRAERLLATLQVACSVISRDWLDRPEAKPGRAGQWDWRITGTGRAFLKHKLSNTKWKVLA